jgi:hypothetical protein
MPSERLTLAFAKFDAANRDDPNRELYEGEQLAKELVYGWRMSQWLDKLAPDASESLQLAARCQHICRWTIPRDSYPMTRGGYKQWRADLAQFHAEKAGTLLQEAGYDAETIKRVQALVRKENLKTDPEMQLLEDVICIVFAENYLQTFAEKHQEDKLVAILRKTWKKMSPRGHQAILELDLPAASRRLLERALGATGQAEE